MAWDYLVHYTRQLPGVEHWVSGPAVEFTLNGAKIQLFGADNPDALRGIYLDGVVLDEYAQMRPGVWSEVIRPALSDRLGWAVFIGTPMGRNSFCELYEQAKQDPSWFTFMLKASETGLINPEELASARKDMSEDQFNQEYECSFDAAIVGSYYGSLINDATEAGRIGLLPYEPRLKVTTAWDLGIGDSTAIWFAQRNAQEIRIIDYYESSGVGLDHYVARLTEGHRKDWAYQSHLLPHDATVRELGSGRSRVETLRSLGVVPQVLPMQSVEDGINAVRTLLPTCWFDEGRCARGIEALRQYRREPLDPRKQPPGSKDAPKAFQPKPLHDWTSHAADAFRYLAMGIKPQSQPPTPIKYKPKGIA